MIKNKISLDKIRVLAAILIIAIHIYPLSSINENLDYIFTHVICRIGVPIFLMITGFFVLPEAITNKKRLIEYTKKILKIYIICMIIYFPVNIYAGHFKEFGVWEILKEIFINGTFYHLWYFPALILGIWITYFLIKNIKENKIIFIVGFLYLIGLFGDSYYGITEKWIVTKNIYDVIFNISEYTRNGLFYVPIFLYLGYMIEHTKIKINKKQNIALIILFLILMIIEGLILKHFNLQRHDSMYIMLIPTMVSIFYLIIQYRGKSNKMLRSISTTIYVMHPIFIILIRGVAKVIKMQDIMVYNSVINYMLVVISTVIFSIVLEKLKEKVSDVKWKRKSKQIERG